jgi:hypothetical protein
MDTSLHDVTYRNMEMFIVPEVKKVKQKVKVKVKFSLEQATKVKRGIEVLLYSSFNLCARWGGWSTPRPGRLTPRKDSVRVV